MDKFRIRSNDKSGIIFDIGIAYTKIGFTGDNGPIRIIRTPSELFSEFKDKIPTLRNRKQPSDFKEAFEEGEKRLTESQIEGNNQLPLQKSETQQIYEQETFVANSLQNIQNLYEKLDIFLNQLFYYELLQKLTNKIIYICKNHLIPHEFYDKLGAILFNKYEITKIQFVLNNSLPLYITGQLSGLVVECGYYDTQITPIYEGFPLMNCLITSKCGGYLINKFLKNYLLKDNTNINFQNIDFLQLEDIKFKYCKLLLKNQEDQYNINEEMITKSKQTLIPTSLIASQIEQPVQLEKSQKSQQIHQQKIQLSYYTSTKSLSQGLFGNVDSDEPNIAYSILQSLQKCDPSVAIKVSKNIIISGGVASTRGFYERLRQEVLFQLDNNPQVHDVKYLKKYLSFTRINYPPNTLPWIGASIVNQLNPNEKYCITIEKFRQNSSVIPDIFGNDYVYMLNQTSKDQEQGNEADDII
ncbi:hypothetical protein ABPG74_021366 [Tetrahymena malaccensis]